MANDKSIELRVALQEYQMETLEEKLAHVATNEDILRLEERMLERMQHFASKEDLERSQQSTRNWILTVILSVTALQFAAQYAMFQLYIR
jgi:hypothetical protein